MIVNSGKIGVGLTNPLEKMQIGDLWTFHDGGNKVIGYNYHWDSGDKRINNSLPSSGIYFDDNGGIKIKTSSNINNNNIVWLDGIIVDNEGNVGIGGSPSLNSYHKLSVNGLYVPKN
ncbi:MAG: hypothetical protein IPO27_12355 [Bacteroidetes bacterium]|nr:hypothetical protein [Bacteroidota bacterium]